MEAAAKPARKPRSKPAHPQALDDEIQRLAQEIYDSRMADARRVAALEVASKLLRKAVQLIEYGNPTPRGKGSAQLHSGQPKIAHPCANCGAESAFRPQPSKWNPNPNYLCPIHAQAYQHEMRAEQVGSGLLSKLRAAQPDAE